MLVDSSVTDPDAGCKVKSTYCMRFLHAVEQAVLSCHDPARETFNRNKRCSVLITLAKHSCLLQDFELVVTGPLQ